MSRTPPAGWYPDPTDPRYDRWWDGASWTAATSAEPADEATHRMGVAETVELHAPAYTDAPDTGADGPRRGTTALLAIAALLLGGGVAAVVALTAVGGTQLATVAGQDTEDAAPDDDADGATADGSDDTAADDTSAEPVDTGDGAAAPEDEGTVLIEVDGVCTAEVDADLPLGTVRAWQLPECAWAPIDPGGGTWIVVVASLNGDDFGASDAEARAREHGLDGRVLWSSHYASLNPNLWVIFDGPFSDEAAAGRAAPPGTYPRLLADDAGERYCLAEDGCEGERS